MTDVEEQLARWLVVGERIGRARENIRPRRSKRAAAKAAGISEAQWRHIEAGRRVVGGVTIPPAVSRQVLEDAARSVNLDPGPLFEHLGWAYEPGQEGPSATTGTAPGFEVRLSRVEADVAGLREELGGIQREVRRVLRRLGPAAGGD